ncbi:C-terminal helicase domain-containing protein [Dolichospermum circinale CS-1225]|uniref:C-terminal helicase domain-containing protein n=1 Tax=Dolichospermum circinale CS-537/01 TaxID=3021739 RepID=A0ABT5A3B0_9CYAN|nr:C-terminal helicase domain-containing protein [Dolichospermum circinale]MDB9458846.1 C-terminal helicase domain-containing protein [Dolichospermum circinale CS-545/17]MDB9468510.1 C-terminal helicase domain-containing protein [Dolichospermum circinale CS-539/09]MDB9470742.1 C-terminal helicase domain-containing protein [Dolichospermum circinale CS-539]MDB9485621.1 C-terminal helicase domain-containing protein [Dolichospermum circinale CS-537/01]MDB9522076.1 C-terminal helicase domain-contai
MGFCRTNLFKRLESSGNAFLASLYKRQAKAIYELYQNKYQKRFKWLDSRLFKSELKKHLREDALSLLKLLHNCGEWNYQQDQKLQTLQKLITETHENEKILIFTQFADTARYLQECLEKTNITQTALVTGKINDPTALAYRFSPESNKQNILQEQQIRILIATDVLSEGQNLQDCRIIINYDLPWAIIRLIQRIGRVDRIGQKASEILCYSFLPAEGVEELINLRGRLSERLQQNANVVGTDEAFFEDSLSDQEILDLYHEKSGFLDKEDDGEVDLTSTGSADYLFIRVIFSTLISSPVSD